MVRFPLRGALVVLLAAPLGGAACSPVQDTSRDPATAAATPTALAAPSAGAGTLDGVPVGFTAEGFPYRGDPDAAVTLIEYSDYLCPFCARFATEILPELSAPYLEAGTVRLEYREFPIAALHPTAPTISEAAVCLGEQGAPLFWKLHDQLFATQAEWRDATDLDRRLADVATDLGADRAAYEACMASGRAASTVAAGVATARGLGFNGTPSFQILRTGADETHVLVGVKPVATFRAWFDALIAGEEPPAEPTPVAPELPTWATDAALAPDPDRPGLTVAGNPFRGNPEADVVVVEFTDYQCPACRRFAAESQSIVDARLIEPGRILWVTKHLPLPEHPQAAAAAVAAVCAAEAGRFWELHEALYAHVEAWSVSPPEPPLVALAATAGLETGSFETCLNSRQPAERVMADMFAAQGITRNVPTFVVLQGREGTIVRGFQPGDQFSDTIERFLELAAAPTATPSE